MDSQSSGQISVGFAGRGRMGVPMAEHLVTTGFDVTVSQPDRSQGERIRRPASEVSATTTWVRLPRSSDSVGVILNDPLP